MTRGAKPHWAFTPAPLQMYVSDVTTALDRARASGVAVVTEPTDFLRPPEVSG